MKPNSSYKKLDLYIAYAVASNSVLLIVQLLLLHLFHVQAEQTTIIRVALVVIMMLPAIIVSFFRRPVLFISTYFVVFFVLLLTLVVFPQNTPFLIYDATRFLLPVVIPCALCVICLPSISVFEHAMNRVSWISFFLMLIYVFSLFSGRIEYYGYDMPLSYALLLPAITLFQQKTPISYIASIAIFIFIVIIGSRGPAGIFVAYLLLESIVKRKNIPILIFLVLLFITILPYIETLLNSFGITSRTLNLAAAGDLGNSSGRDVLYDNTIAQIYEHPFVGLGLWGDRIYCFGVYCHNFFLEICAHFGFFVGPIILSFLILWIIQTYIRTGTENKIIIRKYTFCCIFPLLMSSSYLIDYTFGMFLGIICRINADKNNIIRFNI